MKIKLNKEDTNKLHHLFTTLENNVAVANMLLEFCEHYDFIDKNKFILAKDKKQAFDYIFMDPPYGKLLEKEAVLYLDGSVLCDENTTIIIESDLDTEFSWVMDTGFTITKEKIYKTNKHTFLQRK